jgi:methylated-DNA-protein-cysteine methyltransferase-like protein
VVSHRDGPSEFARAVLDVVDAIPRGRVLSYGDVAELVGVRSARVVGAVLSRYGVEVPWHRVLRADGSCARHLAERQLALLRRDRVPVRDGRVDMRAARWDRAPSS